MLFADAVTIDLTPYVEFLRNNQQTIGFAGAGLVGTVLYYLTRKFNPAGLVYNFLKMIFGSLFAKTARVVPATFLVVGIGALSFCVSELIDYRRTHKIEPTPISAQTVVADIDKLAPVIATASESVKSQFQSDSITAPDIELVQKLTELRVKEYVVKKEAYDRSVAEINAGNYGTFQNIPPNLLLTGSWMSAILSVLSFCFLARNWD